MTPCKSILAAILLPLAMAAASAAEQASPAPASSLREVCADCHTYVVSSPSLEPESYAMRGDTPEITTPSPSAGGRLAARPDGTVVSSNRILQSMDPL